MRGVVDAVLLGHRSACVVTFRVGLTAYYDLESGDQVSIFSDEGKSSMDMAMLIATQAVPAPSSLLPLSTIAHQDVLLAASSRAAIRVFGLPTMQPLHEFTLDCEPHAMQASPTFGQMVLSRHHYWDILLVDWLHGHTLASYKAHDSPIKHLEWHVDAGEAHLLSCSWDRLAKVCSYAIVSDRPANLVLLADEGAVGSSHVRPNRHLPRTRGLGQLSLCFELRQGRKVPMLCKGASLRFCSYC